ncbi:hypothetical protein ABKN59_011691 [Abortiporus biennis]
MIGLTSPLDSMKMTSSDFFPTRSRIGPTEKRAQSLKEELLSFWFTLDLQDSARLSESSKYFLYALSLPESRRQPATENAACMSDFDLILHLFGLLQSSSALWIASTSIRRHCINLEQPTSHWYGLGPYSQNAIQFKGEGTVHLVFSADCFLEKAFVYSEPSELTYAGNPSGDAWIRSLLLQHPIRGLFSIFWIVSLILSKFCFLSSIFPHLKGYTPSSVALVSIIQNVHKAPTLHRFSISPLVYPLSPSPLDVLLGYNACVGTAVTGYM